ncbi:MAG: UDP-N-acetylmuramoyl-L-alanyl-D-glutamate--2,6-diaminopimelate ligase [Clostridia bacterium]|nr:UDP-N-acetylmuramoyl-L-alanyl-D-glutamate--2,6-diaminopimelate ligase [Clostridia bacterium]
MRLNRLLDGVETVKVFNYKNVNILSLTHSSKECKSGSLFFAITGQNFDGNDYILDAIKMGAKVVVTDRLDECCDIVQVVVKDVRKCMSIISKKFYNNAVDKLKVIGIVGTAGKTTTSMIISHILSVLDKKCGVIGTNGIYINNVRYENTFTTPDPIDMHKVFYDMLKDGVEYVVMEVSAQSIYYKKMYGVYIDIGVFTNVSNEHLDFFKTIKNYIDVKTSIFTKNSMAMCVVNIDDDTGKYIANNCGIKCITCSTYSIADFAVVDVKKSDSGQIIYLKNSNTVYAIKTNMIGKFNVYNLVEAIAVGKQLGIDMDTMIYAIKNMADIPGRCNRYLIHGKEVIIDFAHTPDSIDKILDTISTFYKKDMVVVFGAVGYSDLDKRRQMGKCVSKYSNKIIITSDNPGNTQFMDICNDILLGVSNAYVELIEDRESAIRYAYSKMCENEILVILGKGHENFQMIKNTRVPYSDKAVLDRLSVE